MPVQHRQHRGGLEHRAVVPVEHRLVHHGVNALGQCRTLDQMRDMVSVIGVVDLEADDLPAEHVQDQVQLQPPSQHLRRQVGHVQHHSRASAVATCVVGERLLRGAFARPRWRLRLASHSTRLKLDSLARHTPSSASAGTMRAAACRRSMAHGHLQQPLALFRDQGMAVGVGRSA